MDKILKAINIIGSIVPLAVLCMLIVVIRNSKYRDKSKLLPYIIIAVIMFIMLLRS